MTDVPYVDQADCLPRLLFLHLLLSNKSTESLLNLYSYFVSFFFISFLIFSRTSTAYNLFSALLLIPYRLPFFLFVQLLILVSSYNHFLLQGDPLSNAPSTHVISLVTKNSFLQLADRFSANITHFLHNNLKLYWNNMLLELKHSRTLLWFRA